MTKFDTKNLPNLTEEQQEAAAELNQRQLAFSNLVLEKPEHGMSDADCYKKAGYKPRTHQAAESNAALLVSNHKVDHYLSVMRKTSIENAGLTLEYLDKNLKELIDIGPKVDNLTLAYKRIGGISDKFEMSGPGGGPIETTSKVIRVSSRKAKK